MVLLQIDGTCKTLLAVLQGPVLVGALSSLEMLHRLPFKFVELTVAGCHSHSPSSAALQSGSFFCKTFVQTCDMNHVICVEAAAACVRQRNSLLWTITFGAILLSLLYDIHQAT
jgi:hypothetical protein